MERSRQAATTAGLVDRSVMRIRRAVIIVAILLAGCHASNRPDSYLFCDSRTPYSVASPVLSDEATAAVPSPLSALRSVPPTDVDYRAAIEAWRQIEAGDAAAVGSYHKSLARLLTAANRGGRLDCRGRLTVMTEQGVQIIPVSYFGFAWQPADFGQFLPAADYHRNELEHYYFTPGLGVSLVAVRQARCEEKFFRPRQSFPVTAVLRPSQDSAVLELYNPLMFGSIPVGPAILPLDRDLTASLIFLKQESPRRYVEGFFDPGEFNVKPKLVLMEPYQPGKIPVVFIHGLGSDSLTWADAVNKLRAQSDIYQQFQFWFFHYPTGGDLLKSAAALRTNLLIAREEFDPQHRDAALEQIVLVGHSMGGLVAQLQVSYSYDILWQQAARQPLEAVRAESEVREQLRAAFYFDPSPLVKRVVFMATPHHGSSTARRFVGRVASNMVHYSATEEATYRQLVDNNRDIFREYLWKKQPTAIDLLEPDNPLLSAMARMPIGRCVRWHSIIGASLVALDGEASDGVVLESSARLQGACSERWVSARHTRVNKVDESVDELARILREHAQAGFTGRGPQSAETIALPRTPRAASSAGAKDLLR